MIIASWTEGWRRVAQAIGMAALIHAVSFLLALPLALVLRDQIAAQLGSSLAAGTVADGVNNDWWSEFTAQATEHWDGKDRRAMYTYTRPARATLVQVDPGDVLLLDVNRTNNSRTSQSRGDEAARKWSLTWMVWLQELMLTAGFFG